jgi:hypothetical protein
MNFMSDVVRTAIRIAVILCFSIGLQEQAKAGQVFLVGAQLSGTNVDGSWIGDNSQYSTNSSTVHFVLPINGGSGLSISLPLAVGANSFTYETLPGQSNGLGDGTSAGLNLFFNDSGTSYNPGHHSPLATTFIENTTPSR